MDFLKKNGFAVSLSALGLFALVLYYLMVIGKLWGGGLSDARAELDGDKKSYTKFQKMDPPPSQKNKAAVEAAQKAWGEALEEGNKFYVEKRTKFEELPDEFPGNADDVTGFKTFYETRLKKLRDDYLAAFKPKEAAAAPAAPPAAAGTEPTEPPAEGTPAPANATQGAAATVPATAAVTSVPAAAPSPYPQVTMVTKFSSPDDVKRAGKELWIVTDVYRALSELKIDGLQDITFPEREKGSVLEPGARYNWIRSRVTVELQLTEVEPFLVKLLQSDRVPFRLESMSTKRKEEQIITKVLFEQKAGEKPVEPPVELTVELAALNWVDARAPAAGSEKKDNK